MLRCTISIQLTESMTRMLIKRGIECGVVKRLTWEVYFSFNFSANLKLLQKVLFFPQKSGRSYIRRRKEALIGLGCRGGLLRVLGFYEQVLLFGLCGGHSSISPCHNLLGCMFYAIYFFLNIGSVEI